MITGFKYVGEKVGLVNFNKKSVKGLHCFRVILCGFVVLYTTLSICQGSYFLAKQYGNKKYICVTNSSSALSWIQEDIKEKFDYGNAKQEDINFGGAKGYF